MPASKGVQAFGINNAGRIVGNYSNFAGPSGVKGFLLDPASGAVTGLNAVSVANDTRSTGINDLGLIVGDYNDSRDQSDNAFLREPVTGAYTILVDPIGGNTTEVTGINDVGQVVEYYLR